MRTNNKCCCHNVRIFKKAQEREDNKTVFQYTGKFGETKHKHLDPVSLKMSEEKLRALFSKDQVLDIFKDDINEENNDKINI